MNSKLLIPLFVALWPMALPTAMPAQTVRVQVAEASDVPQALVISVHGKCDYSDDGITFLELKPGHIFMQGAVVRSSEGARTDLLFRRIGTVVRLQSST